MPVATCSRLSRKGGELERINSITDMKFVATTDPRNESAERIKGVIWRPFNARMHDVHS